MEVGRVKLWVLHPISWRKPHSYIQGSDGCHLDGQTLMTRCKVLLCFSTNVQSLSRKFSLFLLPWNWLPWSLVHGLLKSGQLLPSNFTFHPLLSQEYWLVILGGHSRMAIICLFIVSFWYSFGFSRILSIKTVLFVEEICQMTLYV